ncbi:MAG: alpha/beta hydrolase [Planctomycetota bacterium]
MSTNASPPPAARPARGRRLLRLAALGCLGWWLCGFVAAWAATAPHPSPIAAQRDLADLPIEPVATTARDGVAVRGWLVDGSRGARCVVLAAGIRGNRMAMRTRAEWYLRHGWSTLLVDLRGTGESAPERIAMGWSEALDLCAWHAFLQQRGYGAVAVHGQSLGAAAAVYTAVRSSSPPRWQFVVLEACYRDIDAALQARLSWMPSFTLWPLRVCSEWLLGVDADELSPLRAIVQLDAPLLVVCGSEDHKVGPDAARLLLAASPARDKHLVTVDGIGHGDLWSAGPALPQALAAFLARR